VGTGQRVAVFSGLILLLAGVGIGVRPLGHATGQLGALYCTVPPTTAPPPTTTTTVPSVPRPRGGSFPGFTPAPFPGEPGYTPPPVPNAIGQGPCPSNTYEPTNLVSAERNCGSAFFPAAFESGALVYSNGGPRIQPIPAGVTQSWSQVPPCSGRLSTWRYPAIALLIAGVVAAFAGFFIFRTRKRSPATEEL
jgi:hypothetical protein